MIVDQRITTWQTQCNMAAGRSIGDVRSIDHTPRFALDVKILKCIEDDPARSRSLGVPSTKEYWSIIHQAHGGSQTRLGHNILLAIFYFAPTFVGTAPFPQIIACISSNFSCFLVLYFSISTKDQW